MAWVTIANVRGPRGLTGPQGGGNWRGPLPVGANLNSYYGSANRGDWGIGEDSTGTQIGSLINLPEVAQGTLSVQSTDTGFSTQIFRPFNKLYFWFRSQKTLGANQWNRWMMSNQSDRGPIPMDYNLNWMHGKSFRGTWWVDNEGGVNQIGTLLNLPEQRQGSLHVAVTDNGFTTHLYRAFNGSIWFRSQKTLGANIWNDWVNLSGGSGGSDVKHTILEQELKRFYGTPVLGNAIPVTIIFDHGTNVFKSDILPALTANGLEATLALNSDMYNPADSRYAHNNNTTWSEIDGWPVEISNHGRTHGNQTSASELETEIVGGLNELKSRLPSKTILTWTQTGQGAGAWMGFENGATADSWAASPAGSMILESHAASTGAVMTSKPALYEMNGDIKQGVWGYWLDSPAGIATAKTRIAEAVTQRKGIILRCHPEVLGGSGNSTVAEVKAFLVWLAGEQSAGRVKSLKFGQWSIANMDQRYTVTETAGRVVKVWDYVNGREQLVYGESGLRDITALAPNITAGKLYLTRSGNEVSLLFSDVVMGGATGSAYDMIAAGGIPVGFRPPVTHWYNGIDGPPGLRRIGVASSGWVPVYLSPVPSDFYRGKVSWSTQQAWPVSLPGTAVGTIPN